MESERGTSTRKDPRKMKGHKVGWKAAEQRDGDLGDMVKKRIGRVMVAWKTVEKMTEEGEIKREDNFKHPEVLLRKERNCLG